MSVEVIRLAPSYQFTFILYINICFQSNVCNNKNFGILENYEKLNRTAHNDNLKIQQNFIKNLQTCPSLLYTASYSNWV